MKISGIYTIYSKIDKKYYVGQSEDIRMRFHRHRSNLIYNKHYNPHLQSAWNKYAEENFVMEILVECSKEFLSSEENYWCNLLNTHNSKFGYNNKQTNPYTMGKNNKESANKRLKRWRDTIESRGYLHSPEARKKIKEARAKQTFSEETRKRIGEKSKGNKYRLGDIQSEETKNKVKEIKKKNAEERGYWFTPETNKKRRDKLVGYKHSEETVKNMTIARRNRKASETFKQNISKAMLKRYYKPFDCFDKEGNLMASFDNIITACRFFGVKKNSNITNVLKGRQKSYLGCTFKYKEV